MRSRGHVRAPTCAHETSLSSTCAHPHLAAPTRTLPRSPPLLQILTVAVDPTGELLATGGQDREVRLWKYDEGNLVAVGKGHSAAVTKVAIAPNGESLVSVGADGAIFFWSMPPALSAPSAIAGSTAQ